MSYRNDTLAAGNLMVVLLELYRSEINVCISAFWDAGWTVKLGDEMNGYSATESFDNEHLHAAGPWLAEEAALRYPDSEFALKYIAALKTRSEQKP